ncbi:MAG: AglZ/HisF2 family acetamidino modification protein [Actinomycetota bacterium]|nr:AglZ/HisF2 family acetamidino modification protein [Actinomycetota bacterium]
MLFPRIIPCLLVKDKGLVKTVNFGAPKYVGDPINAVRIFNEKEADELMVLDIDATRDGREPDFKAISYLAAECQMPLCYGGGVKSPAQVERIVRLGVEKVALSAAAIEDPDAVKAASEVVGSQSVVVVLDVRKNRLRGHHEVWTHNAGRNTGRRPADLAAEMQERGAGEIVVNSIDNDGVMKGYDLAVADEVRAAVTVPLTLLGGAGSQDDLALLVRKYEAIGAAAGSLFVFKGVHRAVLISYPSRSQRDAFLETPHDG